MTITVTQGIREELSRTQGRTMGAGLRGTGLMPFSEVLRSKNGQSLIRCASKMLERSWKDIIEERRESRRKEII